MPFKFTIYDYTSMFTIIFTIFTNFWLAYMSRSMSEFEVTSLGSSGKFFIFIVIYNDFRDSL
jgi:hypothetical protein